MPNNVIVLPDGKVCGTGFTPGIPPRLPRFAAALPHLQYTDSQILQILNNPGRVPASQTFDTHWVVKGDQKQHGSCGGFGLASSASKLRWRQGYRDGLVLSGSWLYAHMNNGQDNGSNPADDIQVLTTYGAPSVDTVDADMIFMNQMPAGAAQEAFRHKGLDMYNAETEQEVKSALAADLPVVVVVQVAGQFQNYNGQGLLPAYRGQGDHIVHCDDLKYVNNQWIYPGANNWGISWGNQGRFEAGWSSFAQTMQTFPFVVVASMQEFL